MKFISAAVAVAALTLAVGQSGNLAGSLPMALAVEAIGWRGSMIVMGVFCVAIALGLFRWVIDPPPVEGGPSGSLLDVLKIKAVWPIYLMMLVAYAPAGGLRGLWSGPYFAEVFAADARLIGIVTLLMGSAMIAGSLVYGPADRLLGTRKWINVVAVGGSALFCLALIILLAFGLLYMLFNGRTELEGITGTTIDTCMCDFLRVARFEATSVSWPGSQAA